MAQPYFFNLAAVKDHGIFFKHFFCNRNIPFFQFQLINGIRIGCRLRQINKNIIQRIFPREPQQVI